MYLISARDAWGAMIWWGDTTVAASSADPYKDNSPGHYQIVSNTFIQPYISPFAFQLPKISLVPTTEKIFLPGDDNPRVAGQCVNFAKYVTKLEYNGNASEWNKYINSETPQIGSIVVMHVGRFGHLGVVIKIEDDTITVRSRNWRGLWIISDDIFNIDDDRIVGYVERIY